MEPPIDQLSQLRVSPSFKITPGRAANMVRIVTQFGVQRTKRFCATQCRPSDHLAVDEDLRPAGEMSTSSSVSPLCSSFLPGGNFR